VSPNSLSAASLRREAPEDASLGAHGPEAARGLGGSSAGVPGCGAAKMDRRKSPRQANRFSRPCWLADLRAKIVEADSPEPLNGPPGFGLRQSAAAWGGMGKVPKRQRTGAVQNAVDSIGLLAGSSNLIASLPGCSARSLSFVGLLATPTACHSSPFTTRIIIARS
jgi:hypothetical protein